MKAYLFSHRGMSATQRGIQIAHVVSELGIKFDPESAEHDRYNRWAREHKTIYHYCAGFSGPLGRIDAALQEISQLTNWPAANFIEDQETWSGMLTATGIIAPDFDPVFSPRMYLQSMEGYGDPSAKDFAMELAIKDPLLEPAHRIQLVTHGLKWAP